MQKLKFEEILKKLNMEDNMMSFFNNGECTRPLLSSDKDAVSLTLFLEDALPFTVYATLINKLEIFLQVNIILEIQTSTCTLSSFDVQKYHD